MHIQHPVGQGHNLRVMGRHDQRLACAAGEADEECEDFFACFFVQIAGGFIGQHQERVLGQGAGNGYPLLRAAGKFVGESAGPVGETLLV